MNIQDLIRAPKSGLHTGAWATGRVPRTAFPMSKLTSKYYRYGPEYCWRLLKFSALGQSCRVLIILNESKEILYGRFGVEVGGDVAVLCDHHFHSKEPGWHCHITLKDVADVYPGIVRSADRKWPQNGADKKFGVNRASALAKVMELYRLQEPGGLFG